MSMPKCVVGEPCAEEDLRRPIAIRVKSTAFSVRFQICMYLGKHLVSS